MTRIYSQTPSFEVLRKAINQYIDGIKEDLWHLNKQIHDNPETALHEHHTHDTITQFLTDHNRPVTRHAYGISTAFESRSGRSSSSGGGGGRLVNFNAEYDALPGLGHACGHNLICTAGVAAYMALSRYLEDHDGVVGRVQLLGTPAEEAVGGKILLLGKGAYDGVDVSLMAHPGSDRTYSKPYVGCCGQPTLANQDLTATFTGRSAHAAANPWQGINALDAIVASYNNISMLRQQIHPDERIHGAITQTPTITNAIPAHTQLKYTVRSGTIERLTSLIPRVEKCIEAGAIATGCTLELKRDSNAYANLKVNTPLAEAFQTYFAAWGVQVTSPSTEPVSASTDMGNVSHVVPGLHPHVGIPVQDPTAFPHNAEFEKASGTREAFERFILVAKALAATGLRVWFDDAFVKKVKEDFARDA